jgi:tetratricopeptide (TPR) repeat protein
MAQQATSNNNDDTFAKALAAFQKQDWKNAVPLLTECLDQAINSKNTSEELTVLGALAAVKRTLGDTAAATQLDLQAKSIYDSQKASTQSAMNLMSLSLDYGFMGQYSKALDFTRLAVGAYKRLGDATGEATSLSQLGYVLNMLGQYDEALDTESRALAKLQALGDRTMQAPVDKNIATIYLALGQPEKALDFALQSVDKLKLLGMPGYVATSLGIVGQCYTALGKYQEALESYQQQLAIVRKSGDHANEARTINSIGQIYLAMAKGGNSLEYDTQAYVYYESALPIAREVGDKVTEQISLEGAGVARLALDQYDKALNLFVQADALEHITGDLASQARTASNIASLLAKKNLNANAAAFYKTSVNLLQKLRANAIGLPAETRTAYDKSISGIYGDAANLLLVLHRSDESGQVSGFIATAAQKDASQYVELTKSEHAFLDRYQAVITTLVGLRNLGRAPSNNTISQIVAEAANAALTKVDG